MKRKNSTCPKILLSGGAGFIGRHFQKRIDCTVYDLVNGDDIRDKSKLEKLFEKERFKMVINLAARAGVPTGELNPYEYISTNIEGTKCLADVCDRYGAKLIHFSSSSVYGGSDKKLKEEDKKEPRSVYGITKLASEGITKMCKDWIIIRPFTVIGENGRPELVINKWLNQYRKGEKITFYGKGDTYRGYTYVGDLIDGVIKASKFNRKDFNLGGDQKVCLADLWKIFKEMYPDAEREMLPLPGYDIPGSIADTTKAEILLNWKPKTNIKKKIKELWQTLR